MAIEKQEEYKSFSEKMKDKNLYERLNTRGVMGEKVTDIINPRTNVYGNLDRFFTGLGARASGDDFPELKKHFDFNKKLGKRGDLITNREYNVLGGMNVADVTEGTKIGDSLTLSALGGLYSLVDSIKEKNQDFFSVEGGIGDYARNTLGILIQNNNPLAKLFLSKKEIQDYKNLYKKMEDEIARDTKDAAKVKY
tara:strand:+ start:1089 stop:1673 length:585 start_codon:yes stop_codon:yes gene_type:complete